MGAVDAYVAGEQVMCCKENTVLKISRTHLSTSKITADWMHKEYDFPSRRTEKRKGLHEM